MTPPVAGGNHLHSRFIKNLGIMLFTSHVEKKSLSVKRVE